MSLTRSGARVPTRRRGPAVLLLGALLGLAPATPGIPPVPPSDGLIVDRVEPDLAADRAGLRPGDRLLGWRPARTGAARRELVDVGEWWRLVRDEAPRGAIELVVGQPPRIARLGPSRWGLEIRPGGSLDLRAPCETIAADDDSARSLARLEQALSSLAPEAGLHLTLCAADLALAGGRAELAHQILRAPSSRWDLDRHPARRLALLERRIVALTELRRCPELAEESTAGRETVETSFAGGPWSAHFLALEARADLACDRLEPAAANAQKALATLERTAPASLELARSRALLASILLERDDYPASLALAESAVADQLRLGEESRELASTWTAIGLNRRRLGQLRRAQTAYESAISAARRAGSRGDDLAIPLLNLGTVASERGDLDGAIAATRSAVEAADADGAARMLSIVSRANLVELLLDAGHRAAAEQVSHQTGALAAELAEGSFPVGVAADVRARVARAGGQLDRAIDWLRRELATFELLGRTTLVARTLETLAEVEQERGDPGAARRALERALALRSGMTPDGMRVADILAQLGEMALVEGDHETAARNLGAALEIRSRLAPDSWKVAESLAALARLDRAVGDPDAANRKLTRATAILDTRAEQQLTDYASRARFRARSIATYRELAHGLVDVGAPQRALLVLERSRARALLTQLAERDLSPVRGAPAAIDRERRATSAAYSRTWNELESTSPTREPERAARLTTELLALRHRLARLVDQMRRQASGARPSTDPETLSVEAGARLLAADELALVFNVGDSRTDVIRLRPDGRVDASVVGLGRAALASRVALLRGFVERGRAGLGDTAALRRVGSRICEELLGAAWPDVADAESLWIVADGPLLTLPWAALTCGSRLEGPRFLVESHRLRTVGSLTLLAALRAMPAASGGELLAFAEPLASARGGAERLPALPAAALEARSAVRLHRGGGRVLLGADASEGALKSAGGGAAVLHLATHALFDPRFPLDSALLLAPGGDEDGRLRAWEILEAVDLDASLVTLSGCSTALGEELAGEGLVGLARAFEYAGARAVLASLWTVDDASTAALMERFYAGLAAGRSRGEALRRAQLELLASPVEAPAEPAALDFLVVPLTRLLGLRSRLDATHPYRWAAFQLDGDDR